MLAGGAVVGAVGDQAQELERFVSDVFELMNVVRSDQHDIAGSDRMVSISFVDFTFPFNNENFVFVGMVVQGSEAPRCYFELSHGEIGCPIVAAEQPAHLAAARTGHSYRL